MVVPTQTTGNYPNLLVQTGKAGNTVLLNRDNLGGYNATDNVVQETDLIASFGTWSSPAYWNGTVYYAGQLDNLIASPLANGQLSTTPTRSSETYAWPGATPAISANGSTQGIVWTIDSSAYSTSGPAVLAAHNASNVATTLYSSNTNLSRDNPGPAVKFTPPTIVNGKVYVATANQLSVYGLLAGVQQAATPVLTPGTSPSMAASQYQLPIAPRVRRSTTRRTELRRPPRRHNTRVPSRSARRRPSMLSPAQAIILSAKWRRRHIQTSPKRVRRLSVWWGRTDGAIRKHQ